MTRSGILFFFFFFFFFFCYIRVSRNHNKSPLNWFAESLALIL